MSDITEIEHHNTHITYRYGVAVAMVLITAAIRLAFLPVLGTTSPYLVFFPAVVFATLYGGLWPGMLAITLSALTADYFWIGPSGLAIDNSADLPELIIFLLSGAIISCAADVLRRIRVRADEAEMQHKIAVTHPQNPDVLLRESDVEREKSRLEALMAALPVGVAMFDVNGGDIGHNSAYTAIWGGNLPPTRGLDAYPQYQAWWPDTGRPVEPEEWGSARASLHGETISGQVIEIQGFDGVRRIVHNSAAPILNADGKVVGSAVAIQDITPLRQAEQALRESEEKSRTLYNAMSESFTLSQAIYDGSGKLDDLRVLEVNPASEVYNGFSRENFIGKTWRELWPDSPKYWWDMCGNVVLTGEDIRHEFYAPDTNRWYELHHFRPGKNLLASLSMEITERKQAEQARERLLIEVEQHAAELDATLGSIAEGLLIYDINGQLVRINAAAGRIMQYQPEEFGLTYSERIAVLNLKKPDGACFASDDTPAMRALRGEAVSGVIMVAERPHGKIWLSVSAAPIYTDKGDMIGAALIFTDITALHELEEQQRVLLHMVSHDLRTPLAIVTGHAELVLDQLGEQQDNEEVAGSLSAIRRGVRRMNTIIQDLTDVARLEGKQFRLNREPLELAPSLESFLGQSSGALDIDRVRLEVPDDLPPVHADGDRLHRIITNLLSNALKYSESPVQVRAFRQDDEVVVSISDLGPGITSDDLPHIFQRFYRAKGTRRADGIGLGLYITRLLVEAHDGRIWVESEPGKGSTFHFTLPMA